MATQSVLHVIPAFQPRTEESETLVPGVEEALAALPEEEEEEEERGETTLRALLAPERLAALFAEKKALREFEVFVATGRSCGRPMQFSRLCIAPHQSFPLHAHANIEVCVVRQGAIRERRLRFVPTRDFPQESFPFSLAHLTENDFDSFVHTAPAVFVNEVGSVHRSFTADDPCDLLVLWAGSHADVPPDFAPSSERVGAAVSVAE